MNFEKSSSNPVGGDAAFEVTLEKCYAFASKGDARFPEEYRLIYEEIARGIEFMECVENVRAVMRLRYCYGHRFTDIAGLLGVTYQWVYELHKIGVGLLEKHLSV